MEMFKWAEVVCSSRRSGGIWFIFGVVAGFSAVVFAVALCAKHALRHGVAEEDNAVTETAWLHWPGWSAVKDGVLSVVKNGGAAESGGGELSRGPQQLYTLIRNNSSFSEGIRTGDLAPAKKKGANQTVIQVGGTPLWQRRILMGERCRLPNFSGLILYDEYGNPLPQYPNRLEDVMK